VWKTNNSVLPLLGGGHGFKPSWGGFLKSKMVGTQWLRWQCNHGFMAATSQRHPEVIHDSWDNEPHHLGCRPGSPPRPRLMFGSSKAPRVTWVMMRCWAARCITGGKWMIRHVFSITLNPDKRLKALHIYVHLNTPYKCDLSSYFKTVKGSRKSHKNKSFRYCAPRDTLNSSWNTFEMTIIIFLVPE